MQFSTLATTAILVSVACAAPAVSEAAVSTPSVAPAATAESHDIGVPQEAIKNVLYLAHDEYPIFSEDAGHAMVVIVNTTLAAQAEAEEGSLLGKRSAEAKWGWLKLRWNQPLAKRDAEAKWGWLKLRWNQPLAKREAEAEPEAKWGWLKLRWNQPLA